MSGFPVVYLGGAKHGQVEVLSRDFTHLSVPVLSRRPEVILVNAESGKKIVDVEVDVDHYRREQFVFGSRRMRVMVHPSLQPVTRPEITDMFFDVILRPEVLTAVIQR